MRKQEIESGIILKELYNENIYFHTLSSMRLEISNVFSYISSSHISFLTKVLSAVGLLNHHKEAVV